MRPGTDIIIEALQSGDRAAAHVLMCAFKEESQRRSPIYDGLRAGYRETLARYVDEYCFGADRTVLVAKVDDEIIGVIMASIWDNLPIYEIGRLGHIVELFVVPQFRRRGVGRMLLRTTEEWFRERGVAYSKIETIAAYDNNRAIYEGLGYGVFLFELRRLLG